MIRPLPSDTTATKSASYSVTMTRVLSLCVAFALCLPALAGEAEKDFKPVTVDGEDVAVVSRERLGRGTFVRIRLVVRGNGASFRLGEARTLDAGVAAMSEWSGMSLNDNYGQPVRADTFIVLAAGPKDSPLKVQKIETDPKTRATKLTFDGGMVVQVTLSGVGMLGGATSRPKN